MVHMIIKMDMADLRKILKSLEDLQVSVTSQSWDDYLDTVQALYEMAKQVQGEGARAVLKAMFDNEELRCNLAFGMAFHDITTPQDLPTDVLQKIKWCAAFMKKNARKFEKRIEKEIAAAERIMNLKEKAIGLLAAALVHEPT